jgi:hypothetical protein
MHFITINHKSFASADLLLNKKGTLFTASFIAPFYVLDFDIRAI